MIIPSCNHFVLMSVESYAYVPALIMKLESIERIYLFFRFLATIQVE